MPGDPAGNERDKMTDMAAVRLHAFGGPDGLRLDRVARPEPGPGEVLVRQVSTSVNPIDLMIRRGEYPRLARDVLPYLGGRDVAGTVEAIGPQTDPAWLGRKVFGLPDLARGSFADFAVLKAGEFAAAPEGVVGAHLGSIPLASVTARQALHKHGRIAPGQRVLVHGGSGGVGHFAVQMARLAGAEVLATASRRNTGLLEDLGAHRAIAHDAEQFEEAAGQVDLVIDLIGGAVQERSWAVLRPGGRLISAVAEPDAARAAKAGAAEARFFIADGYADDLEAVAEAFDAGQLRVLVSRLFPLAETAAAQAALEAGGKPGKIGIAIG